MQGAWSRLLWFLYKKMRVQSVFYFITAAVIITIRYRYYYFF